MADSADLLASVGLVVVEARAALAAASRQRRLNNSQHRKASRAATALIGALHLVAVTDSLIAAAAHLAESEGLRGYDAAHLAGALLVDASILTSADAALCAAARHHGLHVANPLVAGS